MKSSLFYIKVLICALLWGSAFPVIKNSFEYLNLDTFSDKLTFAGSRFLIAGLLLIPFRWKQLIPELLRCKRSTLIIILLGQTVFQYLFFYYGLSVSSGTLGALLVGSGSFWWIILGPPLLKAPHPGFKQWLVLGLCSLGIAMAVYAPGAGSGKVLVGTIAFLSATLSGAVAAIYVKKSSDTISTTTVTAFSLAVGGLILVLLVVHNVPGYLADLTPEKLGITIYLAFVSATGFSIWNKLIEEHSFNRLSSYRFLIPLMGVIESTIFIEGETLSWGLIVGGTVIIGCLIVYPKLRINS